MGALLNAEERRALAPGIGSAGTVSDGDRGVGVIVALAVTVALGVGVPVAVAVGVALDVGVTLKVGARGDQIGHPVWG